MACFGCRGGPLCVLGGQTRHPQARRCLGFAWATGRLAVASSRRVPTVTVGRGAVDSRRRAITWTGIGRYVGALHRYLPEVLGDESPTFLSGGGLHVIRDGETKPNDVLSRTRKVLW